jgi:hypothetical protein
MERLPIDGEDRHLRRSVEGRIVEATRLEEDGSREAGRPCEHVRPALRAELARDRVRQVAPAEHWTLKGDSPTAT